jgi:hypothetical protein
VARLCWPRRRAARGSARPAVSCQESPGLVLFGGAVLIVRFTLVFGFSVQHHGRIGGQIARLPGERLGQQSVASGSPFSASCSRVCEGPRVPVVYALSS